MYLILKNFRPVLFFTATMLVFGCSGSNSTIENVALSASGQSPELGQALATSPEEHSVNKPPILGTVSLGCDLVTESVAIEIGETITFTLNMIDESPTTLAYAAYSANPLVVSSSVEGDGTVTVSGLALGTTVVPIVVTDEDGLKEEIYINIVVTA